MTTFSVTKQGVITVDTSQIQADFETAYRSALGANINTEAGTFQGQMIVNDTQTLTTAMNEVVKVANNLSPFTAKGEALDVIAAVFGYYRKQGTPTTVYVICSGSSGLTIPQGSTVKDQTGNVYQSLDNITLNNGSGAGWFQCLKKGAIQCPVQAITTIDTVISGWDSVTNTSAGITGYERETDNEFAQRITANWLNVRAKSILGAIADNIAAVDNVISVCARENPESTSTTIDGQILLPHSVYLCVLGGNSADIAEVLAKEKTLGATMNGNTNIIYNDTNAGYSQEYVIQRPTAVSLAVQIEYEPNNFTTANIQSTLTALLMEYLSQNPFKIGQTVSGNGLSAAFADFDGINLLSIKLKVVSDVNYADYVTTTIAQVATLDSSNITYSEVV